MSQPLDRLFGLQAKRFAELIGQQGRDTYDALGVDIDAKLNSMVMTLTELRAATSTEIAARTGLSRQLVESRIRRMETDGFVTSEPDPADGRRRLYRLTDTHSKTLQQVADVMADFEDVYSDLWKEIGVDLAAAITKAEQALAAKPLTERLIARHSKYAKLLKESV